jgi:hypothetical protein
MKTKLSLFVASYGGVSLLLVGVIAYVSLSGMFGACPACRVITKSIGLPFLGK